LQSAECQWGCIAIALVPSCIALQSVARANIPHALARHPLAVLGSVKATREVVIHSADVSGAKITFHTSYLGGQNIDRHTSLTAWTAELFITTNWAYTVPRTASNPPKSWPNNPYAQGRGWNFVQVRQAQARGVYLVGQHMLHNTSQAGWPPWSPLASCPPERHLHPQTGVQVAAFRPCSRACSRAIADRPSRLAGWQHVDGGPSTQHYMAQLTECAGAMHGSSTARVWGVGLMRMSCDTPHPLNPLAYTMRVVRTTSTRRAG
jgi:hypothetical protein